MKQGKTWVGTSGWHYLHWIGPFFPPETPPGGFLKHYVQHFKTAEINSTFYRLPREETVIRWRETVPKDFLYSVKASRYITHIKRLLSPEETLPKLMGIADLLQKKLGPILFQLPPNFVVNLERLETFLAALNGRHRCTFEFRNPSWFTDPVYETLTHHNAALCLYDFEGRQAPEVATADFIYIRLHGPLGRYQGLYTPESLEAWAKSITAWTCEGRDVFCYFDNDEAGYAALNAVQLRNMLEN